MIRLWRVLRSASAVYFLISGLLFRRSLPIEEKYWPAFVFMGAYLLFLDVFALYVTAQRRQSVGDFLIRRYGFWEDSQEEFRVRWPQASDGSPIWIRCSGYCAWAPQRMKRERCSDLWSLRLPLRFGEHEYIFECGGQFFTDPNAKMRSNPYGGQNNVREVGYIEFPGARVQITNISTQVLIAIGVGALAFGGQVAPPPAFYSSATSVVAGLVYNFIFGGSIVRERHNGEPHVVTVVGLHQDVMEVLLNVQVLALIFALTALTVK